MVSKGLLRPGAALYRILGKPELKSRLVLMTLWRHEASGQRAFQC